MSNAGRNAIRKRAEEQAAGRLRAISDPSIFRDSPAGYTRRPEQNLVSGVGLSDFAPDLGAGAGNELVDGAGGPAKFCAAFSSSALAVNSFGPFRHQPQNLQLIGHLGFSEVQFEKKLPTGLRGTDPHLDVYAAGPSRIVCIESKFLEPLWPKVAKFADSYKGAIQSLADHAWAGVYDVLKGNPNQFEYLDAAQLVKHYLGMQYTLGASDVTRLLVYLYWEPENAADIEAYQVHREEIAVFSSAVEAGQIGFVALSYPQLWAQWRGSSSWSGMQAHLDHLEQRYSFSI